MGSGSRETNPALADRCFGAGDRLRALPLSVSKRAQRYTGGRAGNREGEAAVNQRIFRRFLSKPTPAAVTADRGGVTVLPSWTSWALVRSFSAS